MWREADLTPPPCGLQWGMSPHECLTVLASPVLRRDSHWVEVALLLAGDVYEARLWTDNRRGLQEIQVVLRISADFPEESWSADEVAAVQEEYEGWYRRYIEEISGMLGAPNGSSWPHANNPRCDVGGGLTYWDRSTGRIELAFYHEGKHAPFELYLIYSSDTFPL